MAMWSGWACVLMIALAAIVPIAYRIRGGKRATPDSPTIRGHVLFGLATAAVAFAHLFMMLPDLGSPQAVSGGVFALLAGGVAFFVLVAHIGIGSQLRNPKLKDRAGKRRLHVTTALTIVAAATVHAVMLRL